jgi:hypothetical protein
MTVNWSRAAGAPDLRLLLKRMILARALEGKEIPIEPNCPPARRDRSDNH